MVNLPEKYTFEHTFQLLSYNFENFVAQHIVLLFLVDNCNATKLLLTAKIMTYEREIIPLENCLVFGLFKMNMQPKNLL